ncbi:Excinuclease ABC subunit A, partial [hydrothermal vent metagenome]
EQKTTSRNPRSTVGTVTEIYDYLRLLFARIGIPYSPATGLPIESQTISQMVDRIMALKEGTRLFLLAPIVRGRKGEYKKELAELLKKGFQRVKINGDFYEIEEAPPLNKKLKHDISIVVDRVVTGSGIEGRLADSLETALGLADGIAVAEFADQKDQDGAARQMMFSQKFACPVSGFTIAEIEPRLFSFNNPFGACPVCDGLGFELKIDPNLVVTEPDLTLDGGAITPWSRSSSPYYRQTLMALCKKFDASMDVPWRKLSEAVREAILFGSGKTIIDFVYDDGLRTYKTSKPFEGIIGNLERRFKETESAGMREEIGRYMSQAPCAACDGQRLRPEALAVKINGLHISQVADKSISSAAEWFEQLPAKLNKNQLTIGTRILKEIRDRLAFLNDVGLDYLTLSRASGSLSGGESQRIRLASQIGSGLTGVLYVL